MSTAFRAKFDRRHPRVSAGPTCDGPSLLQRWSGDYTRTPFTVAVRVERQLGYKMAKFLNRIEVVDRFDNIGRGHGGTWEDDGYEWYAGI